ncbi:MAG: methyltransferase domain-containing protein [Chloroflexi bacterium]|nr:methyltransferase domain-containing protein [Chloroflexota bacterium]
MGKQNRTTYYAQTMPGVEEIAWLEIRERLNTAVFQEYLFAKEQNGIVLFSYKESLDKLLQLRTTEDIFLEAISKKRMSRGREDLKQFYDLAHKSDTFGRAANILLRFRKYSQPPTFRVVSRKYGKHQYRRKDFELALLRGFQARYPRWTPVADNAQVEIWANLLGSRLLIGLRLSDRTMRHRHNKRVELPASLRPSVAAAMVYLTQPGPQDTFLDPMCGSGTILLERLHFGPSQEILGGDLKPDRVDAAKQNLPKPRKGRKKRTISIRQWDARQLPLDDNSIDKVATNLPFGKQIGSRRQLDDLYSSLFAELERVVRPDGRIVVLSSEFDLVKSCIRHRPHLHILTGYSIATLGQWGRIYIIQRYP